MNILNIIFIAKNPLVKGILLAVLLGSLIYGILAPLPVGAASDAEQKFCKALEPAYQVKRTIKVVVTAYSSSWDETTGIPGKPGLITASGASVEEGVVAYNHLPFGTKLRINAPGFENRIFVVKDRTAAGRWNLDMWKPSKQEALEWGAQVLKIDILEG